ncbi:MAG: toprim domain-containing protein, partial [Planctomycetota bacterium]
GIMDKDGNPLAWVGRNLDYDEQRATWESTGRTGREPMKFRFPKTQLFRRGLETYGREWLSHPRFAESLKRYGLIVVEGFNDRLNLHKLGVMSVAIMSNQITDEQVALTIDDANEHAGGRVTLMPDLDAEGIKGAKECLWKFQRQGVHAKLAWSDVRRAGAFRGMQPEQLSEQQWKEVASKPW